jgi:hypothetical protein
MSDSLFISLSYFSGKDRGLNTLPTSREKEGLRHFSKGWGRWELPLVRSKSQKRGAH